MRISAVLFDVDGVLLDSAGAHRRVWDAWSAARGLDSEKVWELTFGRRPEDTVKDVAAHLDPAAERTTLDRLLSQEMGSIQPVEGAPELLETVSGSPRAIVTSDARDFVAARFAAAGLGLPAVQVYGSDVRHAKPARTASPWPRPGSASPRRRAWSWRTLPRGYRRRWLPAASPSA